MSRREARWGSKRVVILLASTLALAAGVLALAWVTGTASAGAATPTPPMKSAAFGATAARASGNWWDIQPRPEWQNLPIVKLPASLDWYEAHRVAPGVFAILEPHNWQEVMTYLVVGTKKAMLIDTGMDIGNIKEVVGKLTKLPVFVVNSHSHPDHVGGNWQFKRVWGYKDAFSVANQAGYAHATVVDFVGPGSMSVTPPARFHVNKYRIKPYKVTHWMKEGDKIDLGNRVLEVVHTPGHSPDGVCLLDRANRLLWVGDDFYNSDLYAHLDESNLADYTASAQKLAALASEVDFILPSHNISMISSQWLVKMNDAFQAIKNGTATDYSDDAEAGVRVYKFDYFKIDVKLIDVQ